MTYLKIPKGEGHKDWAWVSCRDDNAHILGLFEMQKGLHERHPALKTACVALPRKTRGVRSSYFRVVLKPRQDQDGKIRLFFTVYGSRPHDTVRAMTKYWRERGIPWTRVICSDGVSTDLPDWCFNDALYAA